MGSINTLNRDPLHVLEEALKGGITCFQLREKGKGALIGEEKRAFAIECMKLCHKYHIPFIVNDDVELAASIGADGVHIGQDDLALYEAKKMLGEQKIIGISVHHWKEAEFAIKGGAHYVGIGPVYETKSKEDAKMPSGTRVIEDVHRTFPSLPIVGIGGISATNLQPVIAAGAKGVAVISAISHAEHPYQTASMIKNKVVDLLQRSVHNR